MLIFRRSVCCSLLLLLGVLMPVGVSHADEAPLYDWSSYERDLFLLSSKPGPESQARFEETLQRIIGQADAAGRKPAPGLLAEYGYLHFERGDYAEAIELFERERREWPESATLMNKVIERAQEESGE